MRRSLFSSVLALILCAASCGDGDEKNVETQIEVQPKEMKRAAAPDENSIAPSVQESVAPANNTSSPVDSTVKSIDQQEAPNHGTPDDGKLDSVKNSYPKKK
ncbi:MAG: hypothetical protein HQ500_07265 [Flavobacteriales bacterium]|nr:hypothetical protein [Flavobacteriales bacterium]